MYNYESHTSNSNACEDGHVSHKDHCWGFFLSGIMVAISNEKFMCYNPDSYLKFRPIGTSLVMSGLEIILTRHTFLSNKCHYVHKKILRPQSSRLPVQQDYVYIHWRKHRAGQV